MILDFRLDACWSNFLSLLCFHVSWTENGHCDNKCLLCFATGTLAHWSPMFSCSLPLMLCFRECTFYIHSRSIIIGLSARCSFCIALRIDFANHSSKSSVPKIGHTIMPTYEFNIGFKERRRLRYCPAPLMLRLYAKEAIICLCVSYVLFSRFRIMLSR